MNSFNKEPKFLLSSFNFEKDFLSNKIPYLPQYVFLGKSNVGKSSLLNKILNRRNFVKTSNTPGRTRSLNFFSLDERIVFVDVPGYGYAKVSKTEHKTWDKLISSFLVQSHDIKVVFLLVDARRGIKENDIKMIEWLKFFNKNFYIIYTKFDKLTSKEKHIFHEDLAANLHNHEKYIISSTKDNLGIDEIRGIIVDNDL